MGTHTVLHFTNGETLIVKGPPGIVGQAMQAGKMVPLTLMNDRSTIVNTDNVLRIEGTAY